MNVLVEEQTPKYTHRHTHWYTDTDTHSDTLIHRHKIVLLYINTSKCFWKLKLLSASATTHHHSHNRHRHPHHNSSSFFSSSLYRYPTILNTQTQTQIHSYTERYSKLLKGCFICKNSFSVDVISSQISQKFFWRYLSVKIVWNNSTTVISQKILFFSFFPQLFA